MSALMMGGTCIIDFAEASASRLGDNLRLDTLRPLKKTSAKEQVADATAAYFIDGRRSDDDCVLIVSPPNFPLQVQQAVTRARAANARLGNGLGSRVCLPLLADQLHGRTYAVFPRLAGFSDSRFLRRAQTVRAAPSIIAWLAQTLDVTGLEHSSVSDVEACFLEPLSLLVSDEQIAPGVRESARASREMISAGRVRAVTCLQHGDFWTGNILFERSAVRALSPFMQEFRVIDWAGSKADGYPGIDAVRFLLSAFGPGRYSARTLRGYCERASLSPTDLAVSCLCALGQLGSQLNQFPKERFVVLVARVHDFLHNSQFTTGLHSRSAERRRSGTISSMPDSVASKI